MIKLDKLRIAEAISRKMKHKHRLSKREAMLVAVAFEETFELLMEKVKAQVKKNYRKKPKPRYVAKKKKATKTDTRLDGILD